MNIGSIRALCLLALFVLSSPLLAETEREAILNHTQTATWAYYTEPNQNPAPLRWYISQLGYGSSMVGIYSLGPITNGNASWWTVGNSAASIQLTNDGNGSITANYDLDNTTSNTFVDIATNTNVTNSSIHSDRQKIQGQTVPIKWYFFQAPNGSWYIVNTPNYFSGQQILRFAQTNGKYDWKTTDTADLKAIFTNDSSGNTLINFYTNFIDLRKSRWNQEKWNINMGGSYQDFVPGCAAVAVSQLINYYLMSGFQDNWLDSMLNGVQVYPRFQGVMETYLHVGYSTQNGYDFDSSDNLVVQRFIQQVAIGLDSNFDISANGGTGVELYRGEPLENVTLTDKVRTLLRDRFRLNSFSYSVGDQENMVETYLTLLKEKYQPLLSLLMHRKDGTTGGHAVLVDGYRMSSSGKAEFKINFGWGNVSSCSDQWFSLEGNRIDMSKCSKRYNDVKVYGMVIARPNDSRPITP